MDQLVEVVLHLSPQGVHHEVHLFLHHLHLYNHVWWFCICDEWTTNVLSLLSAQGAAAFWSFLVPSLGTGTLFFLPTIVGSRIPLEHLFLQIMVLLSKAFYSRGESLYLSFKGSSTWFISVIVASCHRASEYYITLCLRRGNVTDIFFSFSTDGAN